MTGTELLPSLTQILVTSAGLALLALIPLVVISATCFTKFLMVLALLRNGLGLPQLPPTLVLTTLALILTAAVMHPVLGSVGTGLANIPIDPALWLAEPERTLDLFKVAMEPWRAFLQANSGDAELAWLAPGLDPATDRVPWTAALPAFMLTELGDALRIGVLILLPLLVVDLVVGTLLLSLGMHMLNPTSVSLPFKLLLFLGIGGWLTLSEGVMATYTIPVLP
ncbi:MAG: EscR/YscR/HrcR family type III secretion system export apparatus protein [Deltaproteobacteria bacterium]|nr:MAG: EscR/YscR/HrcR family type III secretion system export apparatus protein [Deltaproteobacteria bacterium]